MAGLGLSEIAGSSGEGVGGGGGRGKMAEVCIRDSVLEPFKSGYKHQNKYKQQVQLFQIKMSRSKDPDCMRRYFACDVIFNVFC